MIAVLSGDPDFEKFAEEFDIEKWEKKSHHHRKQVDMKRHGGNEKKIHQNRKPDQKRQGIEGQGRGAE